MEILFGLFIMLTMLIVIVLLITKNKKQQPTQNTNSLFHQKAPLSVKEQTLYWNLKNALPDHAILPQVSFSRFIYAAEGNKKQNHQKNNTARQKVIDYLICDKAFNIIAAIELDDKSHNAEKDKKRDEILKEAGITIHRYNVNNIPSEEQIKKDISKMLTVRL